MSHFIYQPIINLNESSTEYRLLSKDFVSVEVQGKREVLKIAPEALVLLSQEAFKDISHLLRASHLEQLSLILKDSEASDNDRYVALDLLRNAVIASEMVFPSCQDTGTAIIMGKKGEGVYTGVDDSEFLSKGVYKTFHERNLRYSQIAPLSMFEEENTGSNLPAQIDIYACSGDEYKFLFVAKGGGSANKTYFFQKTKALLNPSSMELFIREEIVKLGTAACPPYHLAVVIGGTSAEANLKTVKLASCHDLDELPTSGNKLGRAFRDREMEKSIHQWSRETEIGAQFGGKYFVHDVRVIRLPRHGASCPVGIGVSCSADRQIKAKINKEGLFLEKLEMNPARFLPTSVVDSDQEEININLNQPMKEILKIFSGLKVATRVMLTGTMCVARDSAHAKLKDLLDDGKDLPDYFKEMLVYYAGPAKTPKGEISGAFGPTTSQRMDPYVPLFQSHGGSMIMLGKGNRTQEVTDACKTHGGFYLGSVGGPAARLGKECIKHIEVLEYEELGMEAIWKIDVENFPAFIIVDDKGNDFFKTRINKL